MEPVQGLNLSRRYISGLEPEVPVAVYVIVVWCVYSEKILMMDRGTVLNM